MQIACIRICGMLDCLKGEKGMSRIINLDSKESVREIMVLVKEDIEQKRREIANTVYRNLMVVSPVNTGRLRIGFACTLNAPSDYLPSEGLYPTYTVDTSAWNDAKTEDIYYITNNVPYAVMVNNGTVKMAPRRFVERAISVVANVVG